MGGNPRGGVVQAAVVRINPATGTQAVITRADELCYPFGIAVNAQGRILVSDFGDLVENSIPIITCDSDRRRRNRGGPGERCSRPGSPPTSATLGELFLGPVGLTVEPSGTVLVVNQRSAPAAVTAVNPANGVQQVITPNVSPTDAFEQPQRVAVAPDGNLLVSDYSLNTLEGGLVSVNRATGAARVFRSSSHVQQPARSRHRGQPRAHGGAELRATDGGGRAARDLRRVRLHRPGRSRPALSVGPRRQPRVRDVHRQRAAGHAHLRLQHDADPARASDRSARRDGRAPRQQNARRSTPSARC